MLRDFVEQYHEALEERHVFPQFEKRGRLIELVRVLREQHQAGGRLTATILRLSSSDQFNTDAARQQLVDSCAAYIRMYRPHRCREETVLFPAMHGVFSGRQLEQLGEQFEEQEDTLLGSRGFERMVDRVAALEKRLGIHDLSKFTPRPGKK